MQKELLSGGWEILKYLFSIFGWLKDSGTFSKCPQMYTLKIMIVESFPSNITNWGCVVFEKWAKKVTK